MKAVRIISLVILVLSFYSCVSILPVNNHYEKAGTLQQGNLELSGQVSKYDINGYGRTESGTRNYGFKAGYGVTDRFDVKLRYERMVYSKNFDGMLQGAHYLSFIPKFAVAPEYFSLMMPFSTYTLKEEYNGNKYKKRVNSIAPQMIFSVTNRKKQMDVSLSMKMDFLWDMGPESESNLFLGANLGAGFSADLRKWAIRPEIGISGDGGETKYISYGIGFQWVIPGKKKG